MIADVFQKKCTKCELVKSLDLFCRNKNTSDGRSVWCNICSNKNNMHWHCANREKALKSSKAWHAANPPDRKAVMERTRKWCQQNPEKAKAIQKNCKHKRRSKNRGQIKAIELSQWASLQKKVCHWCGIKCSVYEIDHRFPLSKGGEHSLRNLVIACRPCNRKKGARCPIEFAQSLGNLL